MSAESESKQICQTLLQMDTTNPPGDEQKAARYLAAQFAEVGVAAELLDGGPKMERTSERSERGSTRTNVVARLRGNGKLPPLLLTAHLDVVEADASKWKYPPFSGIEAEGCLWGRGAIDMKNMAAMCTAIVR
ncbi:MAG TPA: M20/M25/M40 family metallo-hydrolase, partial [Kofleriaceae bacterium]|nr:M20/M25/M40 family metallo-hydrolase [Kofleriaceae bacterium]